MNHQHEAHFRSGMAIIQEVAIFALGLTPKQFDQKTIRVKDQKYHDKIMQTQESGPSKLIYEKII